MPIFEIQLTKSRKTNFTHFPFLWRSYGFSFFPFPFLVVANVNVPKKSVLILELENLPLYLTYYIIFNFLNSFFSCLNTLVCFPKKQACKPRSDASSEHRPFTTHSPGQSVEVAAKKTANCEGFYGNVGGEEEEMFPRELGLIPPIKSFSHPPRSSLNLLHFKWILI